MVVPYIGMKEGARILAAVAGRENAAWAGKIAALAFSCTPVVELLWLRFALSSLPPFLVESPS
jgi:hypothetical protein